MIRKVSINPEFINAYHSLETASKNYKTAVKNYGEDSSQARAAFAKRAFAESLFTSRKGVVEANGNSGISVNNANNILSGYMNNVSSWYA